MLSDQELILLDNLIYFQDVFWEGDSVAQIIDKIIYQLEKKPNLKYAQMQAQEWMELVSVLQSNQKLLHYKATNKTMPFGSQNTGCFGQRAFGEAEGIFGKAWGERSEKG